MDIIKLDEGKTKIDLDIIELDEDRIEFDQLVFSQDWPVFGLNAGFWSCQQRVVGP